MDKTLKKYFILILIIAACLWLLDLVESQSPYLDLILSTTAIFSVMSLLLFILLKKSLKFTNKQAFLSITLSNTLIKMVVAIVILIIYKQMIPHEGGRFVLPFLIIYIGFTIFETIFMMDLSKQTTKNIQK